VVDRLRVTRVSLGSVELGVQAILREKFLMGAVLDDSAVLDVFDEHARGRRNHAKFLWSVYVFKHWANRMVEQGVLHE
jgi:hypothetical protein